VTGASIPAELVEYLEELVRRLGAATTLDAVYVFGSAAQGAYEHGRSDVDVIAVTSEPSSRAVKEALAEAAESLSCPARKQALSFDGWDDPDDARLAAARAGIWRETGAWVSKRQAAATA
jgi:predicted nucleotidyltransferase